MKLSQDLIIFDLEATSSISLEGYQENKNIIQIGAVYLKKMEPQGYVVTDRFDRLVKPQNENISPYISRLTGITSKDLDEAKGFDAISEEFFDWAIRNGKVRNTRLCAWATYFDIPLLRNSYQKYGKDYPFATTAYDIKSWAVMWMIAADVVTDKMNLKNVCAMMGIPYQGKAHNAIDDAEHTALIALKVIEDLLRSEPPPVNRQNSSFSLRS